VRVHAGKVARGAVAADDRDLNQQPPRVVIADDDPFARRIIRSALQDAGIIVVAEAANGQHAVELALFYDPDVVLMDVVMPDLDGISATRRILKDRPQQIVILLTSADNDVGVVGLKSGASGFLNKDVDVDALPRAIAGALAGEAAISRQMGALLVDHLRRTGNSGSPGGMRPIRSELTTREWEVLDLLCERMTTNAIAGQLVLSSETVRSHVKAIYRKLGVNSREQAIAKALEIRRRG
jgi:NarL family two-component system response regulator LiaR